MPKGTRIASGARTHLRGCRQRLRQNRFNFGNLLCLPTAHMLPPGGNGDFGMSPIYGQLLDKQVLSFVH